jgi:periplasmic copper chaperone A
MKAKTLALAAAALFVATAARAHSHKFKNLEIVHPWCIETDASASTVSVYMTVRNSGTRGDRLLGAKTPLAAKAELFDATVTSAQQAKPITSLEAKAGGELVLKRDGPHIVLTGVKKQLGAYDAFTMTLVFERAGKVEVEVQVEEASILEPSKH